MGKIQVLDASLANMIAAGEVVERPSSVVKELLENSIDAEAREIEIRVFGAGRDKIIVKDDGYGMIKEDVLLAFTRHATSKIKTKKDLFNIGTLGFRGEALPSIAAVSKVTLQSCTKDNTGWKVRAENAIVVTVEPSDGRVGTTVTAEELFYNTPARLKHLRNDNTEIANIVDVVTKIALGYPNVKLKLFIDNKEVFQSSGRNNVLEIIADVFGIETARNMLKVDFKDNDFHVSGYISKFNIHKASRRYMTFLLNNRNVKIPLIQSMIKEAYLNYIPVDRYPVTLLNIEVDPRLVDVNVHPAKHEVRLSKDESLAKLVKENIKIALDEATMIPKVEVAKKEVFRPTLDLDSYISEEPLLTSPINQSTDESRMIKNEEPVFHFEEPKVEVKERKINKMRPIGQIHGTYIVAESVDGFYLIDQHAAMERINFEKLSVIMQNQIIMNDLLLPKVIELSFREVQILKDRLDMLEGVGIKCEIFGNNAIRVISIPVWMNNLDVDYYISEMTNQIISNSNINVFSLRSHAISTMACKMSLKANHSITIDEQQELIDNLMKCSNPHSCPHGRPTMIFYSEYELEKLFKRAG